MKSFSVLWAKFGRHFHINTASAAKIPPATPIPIPALFIPAPPVLVAAFEDVEAVEAAVNDAVPVEVAVAVELPVGVAVVVELPVGVAVVVELPVKQLTALGTVTP
jgi:hypothetical protein